MRIAIRAYIIYNIIIMILNNDHDVVDYDCQFRWTGLD